MIGTATMNQPPRIGLIGAGMVSRHHLIAWANISDQARVVAVADPSAENAARRAGEFAIANTYASAEAMLAAEQLDAIDIAAPREMHAPLVRLAAARPSLMCSGASPGERKYDLAVEYQGSYDRTIAHFSPFETAPQDNLETLRLVEDCYRLSGWEARR